MRWLPIVGLMMTACVAKVPPTPDPIVSQTDCVNVYHHILKLVIDDGIANGMFTPDLDHQSMEHELDEIWTDEGTKGKFMLSCERSMTLPMANCALQTSSVQGVALCVQLHSHKH